MKKCSFLLVVLFVSHFSYSQNFYLNLEVKEVLVQAQQDKNNIITPDPQHRIIKWVN